MHARPDRDDAVSVVCQIDPERKNPPSSITAAEIVKIIGERRDGMHDGFRIPILFILNARAFHSALLNQVNDLYR